ncbi:MAG: hypothetical protein JOZ81_07270, partial [Chloroflexi bacterium]|nr:hypothetical protein [Chloroflexota bacterium]
LCVLSVLPYFKFSYVLRTQFFAAPVQATFWALGLGFMSSLLRPRAQQLSLMAASATLVLVSTTAALFAQSNSIRYKTTTDFSKLVYVYQQIHAIAPKIAPGTLILFVADDFTSVPFGLNYDVSEATQVALNVNGILSARDVMGWQPTYSPNGVVFGDFKVLGRPIGKYEYSYSEVMAFDLAPGGRVTLLKTFPDLLLPDGISAVGYRPMARIERGAEDPLRFMRYSSWMKPYDPDSSASADIVDPTAAVRLGDGWYPFETYAGQTFRWVNNDAELVADGSEQGAEVINLQLEPGARPDDQPLKLEVLAPHDRVVGEYQVSRASTVSIEVPASATEFRYRLHVEDSVAPTAADPRTLNFRVFHISETTP